MLHKIKKTSFSLVELIIVIAIIALLSGFAVPAAHAGDLSYLTLVPQTGDSDLVMRNKFNLQSAPKLNSYITASGTLALAPAVVFDKVVIGTAGSSDSKVIIQDGTNAIATISTASQAVLSVNTVITSGSMVVITSGSTAPKLTVIYR